MSLALGFKDFVDLSHTGQPVARMLSNITAK
jgi:hypothetical protein